MSWGTPSGRRRWYLSHAKVYARGRAARPSQHVARVRALVQKIGLEIVEYEWMPDSKQALFVDVYARSERYNQAVAIDGTWDGTQVLMPKHKRALVRKFLICARLEVPHLFVQTRQPAKLEMQLRLWLMRCLPNPSWAFPGGAGAWPSSRWLDLVAEEAAPWDWQGRWRPPLPAVEPGLSRSPGPG